MKNQLIFLVGVLFTVLISCGDKLESNNQINFYVSIDGSDSNNGNDQNSLVADPEFKDLANGDFSLPDDSPALKIGFKPFLLGEAGLR